MIEPVKRQYGLMYFETSLLMMLPLSIHLELDGVAGVLGNHSPCTLPDRQSKKSGARYFFPLCGFYPELVQFGAHSYQGLFGVLHGTQTVRRRTLFW
jgi:hypothetical protein